MSIVHDFRVDQTSPQVEPKALVWLRKNNYYYRSNMSGFTKVSREAGFYLRVEAELHAARIPGVTIEEIT